MAMEQRNSQMVIIMSATILMGNPRVMGSIFGLTVAHTKELSKMD
jgi:hypothetical protein